MILQELRRDTSEKSWVGKVGGEGNKGWGRGSEKSLCAAGLVGQLQGCVCTAGCRVPDREWKYELCGCCGGPDYSEGDPKRRADRTGGGRSRASNRVF